MKTLGNDMIIYKIPQENILIRLKNSFLPIQEEYLGYISEFKNIPKKTKLKLKNSIVSFIKKSKYLLLNFQRYFYDSNAKYADQLIEKWVKSFVNLFFTILITGFVFWIALIGLISIFDFFPFNKISLGPGVWNLLNIIQLGLVVWVSEGIFRFIKYGGKK